MDTLNKEQVLDIIGQDFIVKRQLISNKIQDLSSYISFIYSKCNTYYASTNILEIINDIVTGCINDLNSIYPDSFIFSISKENNAIENNTLRSYFNRLDMCADLKKLLLSLKLYEELTLTNKSFDENKTAMDNYIHVEMYAKCKSVNSYTISEIKDSTSNKDCISIYDLYKKLSTDDTYFADNIYHSVVYLSVKIKNNMYIIVLEKERFSDTMSFEINLLKE